VKILGAWKNLQKLRDSKGKAAKRRLRRRKRAAFGAAARLAGMKRPADRDAAAAFAALWPRPRA